MINEFPCEHYIYLHKWHAREQWSTKKVSAGLIPRAPNLSASSKWNFPNWLGDNIHFLSLISQYILLEKNKILGWYSTMIEIVPFNLGKNSIEEGIVRGKNGYEFIKNSEN